MNKFIMLSLLYWLLFSFSIDLKAQGTGIKITGTVVDSKGQQLSGVSLKVKGGTTGTTTDANGKFSIMVPNIRAVVVFSYIGFITSEELVGAKKILNVKLLEDTQALTEIVVVGYGEVKRKDLTGSVASVNISDLTKAPVTSFDDALAGRVAGVQVTDRKSVV